MKNNYEIYQGSMTSSGSGDNCIVAEATTIKEAKKLFNSLKRDTKGWIIPEHGYLETFIVKNNEFYNILDYFRMERK